MTQDHLHNHELSYRQDFELKPDALNTWQLTRRSQLKATRVFYLAAASQT